MASQAKEKMISVLIVAGYASVRAGLHALVSREADFVVRGEVASGGDAIARLLPGLFPDVVLLDTFGDNGDGAESSLGRVQAALVGLPAPPALVVLGDCPDRDLGPLVRAPLPGWAYLLREADGPQIAHAVRAVHSGLVVLDRSVGLSSLAANKTGDVPRPSLTPLPPQGPGETLTARETEVLQWMAQGLPNKIIASKLGISLHTAKFHVAQILGKLGATSRTEAVTLGARRGYVVL